MMALLSMLSIPTVLLLLLASISQINALAPIPRRSPPLQNTFTAPLEIPAIKKPLTTYMNPKTNVPIDFYVLTIADAKKHLLPGLGPARVTGYDGTFPGPTFRITKGRESVVRLVNNGTRRMNMHLHGSYTRSPWDGWANDVIAPGEYKDYFYPNAIGARTLWYHDHALHNNAVNTYRGMFGMYQIVDDVLDTKIGIPSSSEFDVPLLFSSHYFTAQGDLTDESKERNSIYGDTWLVNGQVQPFKSVEASRYRFRILNGAVSRVLNFTIEADGKAVPFAVVGSDGGIREGPAQTKSLVTGMAERWEIVIDFAPYAGKNLIMRATNMWTDTFFKDSDKIMQFRVGKTKSVPTSHLVDIPLPERFPDVSLDVSATEPKAAKEFRLVSHMDMMWGINAHVMNSSMKGVLMRPALGTTERYIFRSSGMGGGMMGGMMGGKGKGNGMGSMMGGKGMSMPKASKTNTVPVPVPVPAAMPKDGGHSTHHKRASSKFQRRQMGGMMGSKSGGKISSRSPTYWTHVMHLHLVDMKVVSRSKENPNRSEGRDYLEPYEQNSVKDSVLLGSNEIVEVLVKFQPYPGIYMWHCHNGVHENKGMMAVMNITRLADLGYSELDTRLEDPLDTRFVAKAYVGTDLENVKSVVLPGFAELNAYPEPLKLVSVVDRYWAKGGARDAGRKVAPGSDSSKMAFHEAHHEKEIGGMGMELPVGVSETGHNSHHG